VPQERAFGRALACHSWLSLVLQGAADLDLRGYIKDNLYPRKSSNIPRTMACKQAAMSWIFNGAGVYWNYLCWWKSPCTSLKLA